MQILKFYKPTCSIVCFLLIIAGPLAAQEAVKSTADTDFQYGELLARDGYIDLAVEQFKEFLARYPQEKRAPQALEKIATYQFRLGAYPEARASYELLQRRFPVEALKAGAGFWIGKCFEKASDFAAAARAYERFARFDPSHPNSPEAFLQAASLYLRLDEFERGRRILYELLDLYPEKVSVRARARSDLMHDFLARGEYERAFAAADAFLRDFSDVRASANVWLTKARILRKMGQFQSAISAYQTLQSKFAKTPAARRATIELAELLHLIGEQEAAHRSLQKILAAEPDSLVMAATLLNARLHLREENPDSALAILETMRPVDGAHPDYWRLLGDCQAKLGNYGAASDSYDHLLSGMNSADSDSGATLYRAAKIALLAEDSARLEAYLARLETAAVRKELAPAITLLRADMAFSLQRDYPRAIRAYSDFLEHYPEHVCVDDAQMKLARSYEALQHWPLARAEWQRFLAAYPASEHYSLARQHYAAVKKLSRPDITRLAKELVKAADGDGASMPAALATAKMHLALREHQQALPLLKRIIADHEDRALRGEALILLAEAYAALGERALLKQLPGATAWFDSARVAISLVRERYSSPDRARDIDLLFGMLELRKGAEAHAAVLDSLSQRYSQDASFAPIHTEALNRYIPRFAAFDSLRSVQFRTRLESLEKLTPELAQISGWLSGELFLAQGDTAAALQRYKQVLDSPLANPLRVKCELKLSRILAASGDTEAAMQRLRRIGEKYYYSSAADSALLALARLAVRENAPEQALQALGALKERRESEGEIWRPALPDDYGFVLGRAFELSEQPLHASRAYLNFIDHAQRPELVSRALFALGNLARNMHIDELAGNYYRESISRAGKAASLEAKFALCKLEYESESYETARKLALELLREAQGETEIRAAMRLAILSGLRGGLIAQTESDLRNFETRFPDARDAIAEIQYELGQAHLRRKNFPQAEKIFKNLQKAEKGTPRAIYGDFGLSKSLLIQNKFEDALKLLTAIPAKYPQHPFLRTVYLNLGDFYQAQQQWDNAVEALKKVVSDSIRDHTYKLALRQLINVYENSGAFEWAISNIRRYLQEFPNDAQYVSLRIKHGSLLRRMGRYREAIALFKELKPLVSGETAVEVQYYIADSYFDAGRLENAIAEYLRLKYFAVPTKMNWQTTAMYKAGISYMRLKKYEKAKGLFEEVIRREGGGSIFGRHAMERIKEIEAQLTTEQGKSD